ncbi:hypothetical protein [Xylocopilactobacillus apis]|uniref:Uncharacterized protein n=1 Tax=Xylocopilactobacillus apis TaxID=2932183 RepID=A0AAU9DJR0_9LACO|nr:hypothetical protein [Xylocopilactobacillus apis]BDR55654.1 hypothetical protein KIMC2_02160 [Xylocopilactobacillus apis]
MAVLIYLNPDHDWNDAFKKIFSYQDETIYLASMVPTVDTIEKVPNDEINFPVLPPHIVKENNQRAELLDRLSNFAKKIEVENPSLKLISTLVGKDLETLKTMLMESDLEINDFLEF